MITFTLKLLPSWIKRHFRGKRRFQPFFERLYNLALVGMNYDDGFFPSFSGELYLLRELYRHNSQSGRGDRFVIFDVGANVGEYSEAALDMFNRQCEVYAFEPSQHAFRQLTKRLENAQNVSLINVALSDVDGTANLYSDWRGSPVASLYAERLRECGAQVADVQKVATRRLDDFCRQHDVAHINLLKMDVEGHELNVLQGAARMIEKGAIDSIQFEFSNCNIASRTYFSDFFEFLSPRYDIFRILKDGLYPIRRSYEYEIFRTVNYYAERKCGILKR